MQWFNHLSTCGNYLSGFTRWAIYRNLQLLKKPATILFLLVFSLVSIVMPYGNFDDNFATRLVYDQQQEQDPDLTLSEFIFGKLLFVGDLIDEDDDALPPKPPLKESPFQTLQIQAGSIEIAKPEVKVQDITATKVKPSCLFRENKFAREFSFPVFHPPTA